MNDKNILVVGASSGIGKAIAINLAKDHKVIAVARREERLNALEEYGVKPIMFDVSHTAEINKFVKNLVSKIGKMSALIYCAGVQDVKPLRVLKVEEAKMMFDVNFFGALFFAKAFASKLVRAKKNASVIFISSIAGRKPEAGIINYSASKAAIDNLTKGLAKEMAPIRVNAIAPGFLKTEMTEKFKYIYNDDFVQNVEKGYPLGLGSVEDVGNMARFLISEQASYVTGNIIRVDGGGAL